MWRRSRSGGDKLGVFGWIGSAERGLCYGWRGAEAS